MFVQCIVYCVQCTPSPPVAEICARLADNFCQYMTTVSCWANSLVWVALCYFTVTQPYTTWPRWREQGGGLCSLPLVKTEVNGDSGNTYDRGPSSCWFVGLVVPVQEIFVLAQLLQSAWFKIFIPHRRLFQFICPHCLASWTGSRAGSPVSQYVSLHSIDKNFHVSTPEQIKLTSSTIFTERKCRIRGIHWLVSWRPQMNSQLPGKDVIFQLNMTEVTDHFYLSCMILYFIQKGK